MRKSERTELSAEADRKESNGEEATDIYIERGRESEKEGEARGARHRDRQNYYEGKRERGTGQDKGRGRDTCTRREREREEKKERGGGRSRARERQEGREKGKEKRCRIARCFGIRCTRRRNDREITREGWVKIGENRAGRKEAKRGKRRGRDA